MRRSSDRQCLVWWKSSSSLHAGNYGPAETIYVQVLARAAGRGTTAANLQALPEPRAGVHPCLAKCLWEFSQGPAKTQYTLTCAHTHTHTSSCCCGLCKPLENWGPCWAAKMRITSQKPSQHNSLLSKKLSWKLAVPTRFFPHQEMICPSA